MHNGKSIIDDWNMLSTRFENKLNKTEHDIFSDAMFILLIWSKINLTNIDRLRFLNLPVIKILTSHTSSPGAKKANSDIAKGLEAELLLVKGIIQDILFEEDQEPLLLSIAVLITFKNYNGPTLSILEGIKVPIHLAWAIKVYKSQGLMLSKAIIDLENKEFTAKLLFIAISRVYALIDIIF
ncbi:23606_t:CDS:2 [Cetraspora pellucida]|uniref:23606_t:CDS:1 n=1 Tax=Cetraspora pellucida TaxID=1433469 RepID=A0A9N8WSP0_9GLOM|nr:23606_t:CDS:2 [Cetraspora pellucida]